MSRKKSTSVFAERMRVLLASDNLPRNVPREAIASYARGRSPTVEMVRRLAAFFGIKRAQLFVALLLLSLIQPGCSMFCSTPTALDTEYRERNIRLRAWVAKILERQPTVVTVEEMEAIALALQACEQYERAVWSEVPK